MVARHKPAKVRVVSGEAPTTPRAAAGVRRCDLEWQVVEPFPHGALVEVQLGTGFLHQIRVMMAHLGHPVIGDPLYGSPGPSPLAPRPMLHAARLTIGDIDAASPDPPDLAACLERMRTP